MLAASLAAVSACASPGPRRPPEILGSPELRASWVVGSKLTDAGSVRQVVDEARAMNLNALVVQVRARGDAIFQSAIEPPAAHLEGRTGDLLAEAIRQASGDLEIHAWVNACLVANADALPHDNRHVTVAHPEWMSVPQALAAELWHVPPRSPSYRETLARYASEHKNEVEGLFGDPMIPEYRAHVVSVVADLCRRYRISGIHLDYIRYPGPGWGYSRGALDLFRVSVDRELPAGERADMAERAAKDPLVYARRYPARFAEFRRAAVTRLVQEVSQACRERGVTLTAAVFPDIADAREKRFQEWPAWLERGDVAAACPMIYTTDAEKFEEQARAAVNARGRGAIWAGIGAWKLDAQEITRRVEVVRQAGASGILLFSHHALREIQGASAALRGGPFAFRARSVTRT
jgi:uncharacterized lipoprotein YddW (UPF0748 family)